MKSAEFQAISLSSEININKISQHFGIDKKLKWEDVLILGEDYLKGILKSPSNKYVYIFHFGSIVFINLTHHEIMDIVNYLKKIEKNLNIKTPFEFIDEFSIFVDQNKDVIMNYEDMSVPQMEDYHLEILATVLAKSVSLENVEKGIEILTDEIEDIFELLDKVRLNYSENKLSTIWSQIL